MSMQLLPIDIEKPKITNSLHLKVLKYYFKQSTNIKFTHLNASK